jgi:hypothetical protein
MQRILLPAVLGFALFAADDPWIKVQELKSGTELRIYKISAKQPLLAKMDRTTEESIVIVVKNEQVSIPKEEVDRLDYRPPGGSRMTKQATTKTNTVGNPSPDQQRIGGGSPVPSSSSSTSFTLGSKPDFQTVYRRPPVTPNK